MLSATIDVPTLVTFFKVAGIFKEPVYLRATEKDLHVHTRTYTNDANLSCILSANAFSEWDYVGDSLLFVDADHIAERLKLLKEEEEIRFVIDFTNNKGKLNVFASKSVFNFAASAPPYIKEGVAYTPTAGYGYTIETTNKQLRSALAACAKLSSEVFTLTVNSMGAFLSSSNDVAHVEYNLMCPPPLFAGDQIEFITQHPTPTLRPFLSAINSKAIAEDITVKGGAPSSGYAPITVDSVPTSIAADSDRVVDASSSRRGSFSLTMAQFVSDPYVTQTVGEDSSEQGQKA